MRDMNFDAERLAVAWIAVAAFEIVVDLAYIAVAAKGQSSRCLDESFDDDVTLPPDDAAWLEGA